jgi:hypothetical protein
MTKATDTNPGYVIILLFKATTVKRKRRSVMLLPLLLHYRITTFINLVYAVSGLCRTPQTLYHAIL